MSKFSISRITLNVKNDEESKTDSVGAGLFIQNGDGVDKDVRFTILPTKDINNIEKSSYTGRSTSENRSWVTELKDIILNYDDDAKTGKRVLSEDELPSFKENTTVVETNSDNGYDSDNLVNVAHCYDVDIVENGDYLIMTNISYSSNKKRRGIKFRWYLNDDPITETHYVEAFQQGVIDTLSINVSKNINKGINNIELRFCTEKRSVTVEVIKTSIIVMKNN
jgi:hypothetical protein